MPTNKPTHTPGPWEVTTDEGVKHGRVHVGRRLSPSYIDPLLTVGNADDPQSFADARLIAAAPDLLAACKAHMESVDALKLDGYDDMRAAIAKAEQE